MPRNRKDDNEETIDHLYHFDPDEIERQRVDPKQGPCTIVMVGARRTGKSTLIEDLMRRCKNIPRGLIVTGTRNSARKFSKFFPKMCIIDAKDKDLIKRIGDIIKEQQSYIKKIERGDTTTDYSMFILFDDCGYDTKLVRNTTMNELFMNGRHYKIMIMMAIQYARSIPPGIRLNVDYLFVMREPSIDQRKKLYTDYAGIAKDPKVFNRIMDTCTQDYGCLVIDKTVNSNELDENLFYYKAVIDKTPFRVGSKELWNFFEKNYVSSDEEEDDPNDIKGSNGITIKKKK